MSSAIAIITYNRLDALRTTLDGLLKHCPYPTAVFDDCGQKDATAAFLSKGKGKDRPDLMAVEYQHDGFKAFLGTRNLGVACNSNRALKWLMDESGADHFCLLNDDLHVEGDFVDFYRAAHSDLGVGLFCLCDFDKASPAISGRPETYRWVTVRSRGYNVKLLPRLTGIMMSFGRALVDKIGYFDASFGKFGEEHCDYSYRARFAGFSRLDGQDQNGIDIDHYRVGEPQEVLLRHQDVPTSMSGPEREVANQEASVAMHAASISYRSEHIYRPFRLYLPKVVGAYGGAGIAVDELLETYALVTDLA